MPLGQLANVEFTSSPMQISHFNLQRSVTVTADVESGQSVDQATRVIIDQLDAYEWPEGYRYYIAGELESREESFGGMLKAVMIALIAIFGVLVLQFRSFRQPLIVFAAIPLAMIGSIIALLLTGNTFSFTAFVGLTSLVGIVVNNSIILVDYTNQLRQDGRSLPEALKEACETRFTPIILTTATTVGGLLPLTLGGGSIWAPMGWTIIGGLVVSTLLTLLVVPVLCGSLRGAKWKQDEFLATNLQECSQMVLGRRSSVARCASLALRASRHGGYAGHRPFGRYWGLRDNTFSRLPHGSFIPKSPRSHISKQFMSHPDQSRRSKRDLSMFRDSLRSPGVSIRCRSMKKGLAKYHWGTLISSQYH